MKRIAYWTCFVLVVLPMLHQAADRWLDWHIALSTPTWFYSTGLRLYNGLLLERGGFAPDYILREGFPFLLWIAIGSAGVVLIVRRIVLAAISGSLAPPASFRGWSVLLAGFALGLWVFHFLASFYVPVFDHVSRLFWSTANADLFAAGLLMLWFWLTELNAIAWTTPWRDLTRRSRADARKAPRAERER